MAVMADSTRSAADLEGVSELMARLSDPQTVAALNSLLDNLPLIAIMVRGLDEFMRRADVVADTVADSLREVKAGSESTGMNLRDTSEQLAILIPALAEAAPAIKRVVESTIVAEDAVDVVNAAAESLIEGGEKTHRQDLRIGLGGALKASREPDFQRGLAMMVEVLTALGRRLGEPLPERSPAGK